MVRGGVYDSVGAVRIAGAAGERQASATTTSSQRRVLERYAADTWKSFVALVDARHRSAGRQYQRAYERSLALHLADQHRRLYLEHARGPRYRIIKPKEARDRIAQTLATLASWSATHAERAVLQLVRSRKPAQKLTDLARRRQHGLPVPVERRQRLAGDGADHGDQHRAAATQTRPRAIVDEHGLRLLLRSGGRPVARRLLGRDAAARLLYRTDNYRGRGPNVYYTCHHYGSLNTEPRIASYIAIAKDGVPATHYFKMWRTFPDTCDWSWQEMKPERRDAHLPGRGGVRGPLHLSRHEHRADVGRQHVRGADGAAVRARGGVGRAQLGRQPPAVRSGADRAWPRGSRIRLLGLFAVQQPAGGYREYGVDPIGLEPNGYASDQERTSSTMASATRRGPATAGP